MKRTLMFFVACLGSLALSGCEMASSDSGAVDYHQANIDARTALLQAANDDDPMTRTHAMEAIGQTLGRGQGELLEQGLDDPNVMARFAAAMSLGDIRYAPAKGRLEQLILNEKTDQRVVCAAIYALYRMGDTRYAGQLGSMLTSDFPLGRGTAAMIMGKMAEPSAMGPLKALLEEEHDPGVRFNIVEALSGLGDKKSQRILESYAKGYYLDMRLVAIPALSKANPNTQPILQNMLKNDQPPRVRVAAAGAMGKLGLGDKACFNICVQAVTLPKKMLQAGYGQAGKIKPLDVSSLRRLGAISLGNLGQAEAIGYLRPLLYGDDGSVQVAAAMGILKIVGPTEHQRDDDELDEDGRGKGGRGEDGLDEDDQGEQDLRPIKRGPKLQTSGGLDE